ncbi:MAG: hypothetical protein Q4G34_11520, partial [Micrococcus sp.]|nr:hypothetical protein [Micrococcus sp.]
GVLIGAAMVAVSVLFGSFAFGLVAVIPGVAGLLSQARELVRAPRIDGVSPAFLTIFAVNFALWGTWGLLVGDPALLVTNVITTAVATFNLVWYIGRRLRERNAEVVEEPVACSV